ncbi:hypothetical protein MXD62_33095 [Frankia sp. Mgl5]|uniref:hypothetical protein n=1 Tax=Frankia sp. Mgl5 TaxID=2933793 RepID=UPI00200D1899|nr:hypothetical protein [Frankia sp. Mgl5]MCK9931919.1 hypothetical protein [Frankia sp. Mgl5]
MDGACGAVCAAAFDPVIFGDPERQLFSVAAALVPLSLIKGFLLDRSWRGAGIPHASS